MDVDEQIVRLISNVPIEEGDFIAVVTTYQGSLSLRIHAQGFLDIAALGIKQAVKNEGAIDSITPSILYAIRHATELFLKYVIADLSEKYQKKEILVTGHKLQDIFREKKEEIALSLEFESSQSAFKYRAWLKQFESVINELHAIDPDGSTLRYPADTKGKPNLGHTMQVSLKQVEAFVRYTEDCFLKFTTRNC